MLKDSFLKEICSCGLSLDDSCIRNIFLLLGTRNIGCLDANEVSSERFRRNLKLEDDTFVSHY
ncbi:Uncharacterized protein APZ42_016428 [Daphnia magna]|uniref:Uncharacterized protein n=1 Tax=Daphnia magna TaxID=35525 RepID=A0A0P5HCV5_9CRUS|nr:Uncharacterized protein APZ42_016428 [Daphnia magna]